MAVSDKSVQNKMHRSKIRKFGVLCSLSILIISFQNCQQFEPLDQAELNSLSGGPSGDGDLDEEARKKRLAECVSLLGKPSISSLSISEVTVLSGMANGAGDANSANITVQASR
ncbi:MAG: hypothetical protein AAGB31_13995, partial [Bdellovibrio sp.]